MSSRRRSHRTPEPGPERGATGWVRGPAWDSFFLLGGLWLTPIVCGLAYGSRDPSAGPVNELYMVLSATLWIGHRLGSGYLAYCTGAYRPLLSAEPIRFVWAPLATLVLVLAFLVPTGVWPWPRAERIVAVAIVDFGFLTYHFAAQHFGVLSLYRMRAGPPRPRSARTIDRLFALGVGGALVFLADAMVGNEFHQDVWLHPWIGETTLSEAFGSVRVLGTGVVLVASAALLRLERIAPAPSAPRAAYLASLSLLVLAVFWLDPFLFLVLWTAQHWLAAIGLTTAVASGDRAPSPSHWVRTWQPLSVRPWLLLAFLTALSTLLLPVMEVEAVEPSARYGPAIFPEGWVTALDRSPWVPVLVALGFVTGFVHYQLDRAVFRLSDPRVREAAGSLLRGRLYRLGRP